MIKKIISILSIIAVLSFGVLNLMLIVNAQEETCTISIGDFSIDRDKKIAKVNCIFNNNTNNPASCSFYYEGYEVRQSNVELTSVIKGYTSTVLPNSSKEIEITAFLINTSDPITFTFYKAETGEKIEQTYEINIDYSDVEIMNEIVAKKEVIPNTGSEKGYLICSILTLISDIIVLGILTYDLTQIKKRK